MSNDQFDPRGVIPACLMPFDSDLEIDEAAYRRHLSDLAGVDGIAAITANGHPPRFTRSALRNNSAALRSPAMKSLENCRWWLAFTRETLVKQAASPPWRRRPERTHCWCFPQKC